MYIYYNDVSFWTFTRIKCKHCEHLQLNCRAFDVQVNYLLYWMFILVGSQDNQQKKNMNKIAKNNLKCEKWHLDHVVVWKYWIHFNAQSPKNTAQFSSMAIMFLFPWNMHIPPLIVFITIKIFRNKRNKIQPPLRFVNTNQS